MDDTHSARDCTPALPVGRARSRQSTRLGAVIFAAASLCALVLASVAPAATVRFNSESITERASSNDVDFVAGPGETNRAEISFSGKSVVITDAGADLTVIPRLGPLGDCHSDGPSRVVCDRPQFGVHLD